MTIEKRGGYKVNLDLLTAKATDTVAYILSWSRNASDSVDLKTKNVTISKPSYSAHTPSVKKKFISNLRDTIWNMMDNSSRYSAHKGIKSKVSTHALALTTKYDYMGLIRESVNIALQVKHSKLEKQVTALIKKYPNHPKSLNDLLTCKAEDVPLILRKIRASLNKADPVERQIHIKLNEIKGMNELIAMLKPLETDIELRSENMTKNRTKRKRNAKLINFSEINHAIDKGFTSDNFYEIAVAVALATGRRFIEVIHTGQFDLSEEGEFFFEVSGIAKKIDPDSRFKVYTLPSIIPAEKIVEAVNKLRTHKTYTGWMAALTGLTYKELNKALNNRAAREASETFNRIMKRQPKELVFKDTRSIAGLIAQEKIFPLNHEIWKGFDADEFKTYYLLHDNLEEAVNYGHIDLSFDDNHKIDLYYAPEKKANNRSRGNVVTDADVSPLLEVKIINDKPLSKLHDKVIAVMSKTAFKLSASLVYKGKIINGERVKIGGSMPVIKRYLANEDVDRALKAVYTINDIS